MNKNNNVKIKINKLALKKTIIIKIHHKSNLLTMNNNNNNRKEIKLFLKQKIQLC